MSINTNRIVDNLPRDLFVLEDESNPSSSKVNSIWPTTVLDQVYDNLSPTNKTLRQIIEDLKQDIITGGRGNIIFPVTSVNNRTGDIIIGKNEVGLGNVDNTADKDKPLSDPQRESISKILEDYDFKVNLSDLYDHIMNMNNPHDVTIDQLNENDELATFVQDYISRHNFSGDKSIHVDIRRSLSQLWVLVDDVNKTLRERMEELCNTLTDHIEDWNPHQEAFDKKEDVENKVMTFDKSVNNDHKHYASTRAIVEFVARKLEEFHDTLPDVRTWVQDIYVIDNRDQLPTASAERLRTAYFIRNGLVSHDEIAICRPNDDGTYYWDISQLGSYSKFDSKYFMDSPDGLTLNLPNLRAEVGGGTGSGSTTPGDTDTDTDNGCKCADAFSSPNTKSISNLTSAIFNNSDYINLQLTDIYHKCDEDNYETLNEKTIRNNVTKIFNKDSNIQLDTTPHASEPCDENGCHCPDMFEGITTTEIDRITESLFKNITPKVDTYPIEDFGVSKDVKTINIVSGTMDGCIRFYINGDMTTMSENIKVAGLKRLAYMEYVTESEIWDEAVQENHIRDSAIRTRHIHEMAVTPDKIKCTDGFIIGNTKNEDQPKAHEVSLIELANILRPLIGGWPDPNTPGGNPFYEQIAVQIPHPHLWKINVEYNLGDYSYGMRFRGTISCIPNMDLKTELSPNITTKNGYRLTDAGGSWVYQSDPESWTILGGSNITGHTFATITMDTRGIYFESISTGDRMNAEYDVWIRYIKKREYNNLAPELDNGGYVQPGVTSPGDGTTSGGSNVGTGVVGSMGGSGCNDCKSSHLVVYDNMMLIITGDLDLVNVDDHTLTIESDLVGGCNHGFETYFSNNNLVIF